MLHRMGSIWAKNALTHTHMQYAGTHRYTHTHTQAGPHTHSHTHTHIPRRAPAKMRTHSLMVFIMTVEHVLAGRGILTSAKCSCTSACKRKGALGPYSTLLPGAS